MHADGDHRQNLPSVPYCHCTLPAYPGMPRCHDCNDTVFSDEMFPLLHSDACTLQSKAKREPAWNRSAMWTAGFPRCSSIPEESNVRSRKLRAGFLCSTCHQGFLSRVTDQLGLFTSGPTGRLLGRHPIEPSACMRSAHLRMASRPDSFPSAPAAARAIYMRLPAVDRSVSSSTSLLVDGDLTYRSPCRTPRSPRSPASPARACGAPR